MSAGPALNAIGQGLVHGIMDAGKRTRALFIPLDEENLIRQARQETELDDFGDDSFREPLRVLLRAYEREAGLTVMGRFAARQDTLRMLRNRLLVQEDRKRFPLITAEEIRRPLFITGLPRSGTTLLHNLLANDPANRAPLGWEVMFPSPPPEGERLNCDPRIARAEGLMAWIYRLAPDLRRIHSVGARLPQECIAITSHAFLSNQFETTHHVPSYQMWLDQQRMHSAYEFHRRFLQQLQWRCDARRWILKAPAHLFALDDLLDVYPDARIIHTHRDPLVAVASLASLVTTLHRAFSRDVDPVRIGPEVTRRWAGAVERAMRVRARMGDADRRVFFDAHYDDLVRNPIATVERLYEWLELELTDTVITRMRAFLEWSPQHRFGAHRYALKQFGLDPDEEDQRYSRYRERYRVRRAQGSEKAA